MNEHAANSESENKTTLDGENGRPSEEDTKNVENTIESTRAQCTMTTTAEFERTWESWLCVAKKKRYVGRQMASGASVILARGTVEKDPAVYNSASTSFQRLLAWTDEKEKIAEVVASCIPVHGRRLLDVGAGTGAVTVRLASLFDEVVAVEPSAALFAELSVLVDDKKSSSATTTYRLVNSTFESAALSEEKYDVVLASYSFRYVTDQQKQLLRIRDDLLAKPNGTFVLVDLAPDSRFWSFYLPDEKRIRGVETDPSTYDYASRLGKIFSGVVARRFSSTMEMPSVDTAMSVLDFFYEVETSKIPTDALAAVRSRLTREYGCGPVIVNFDHVAYACRP